MNCATSIAVDNKEGLTRLFRDTCTIFTDGNGLREDGCIVLFLCLFVYVFTYIRICLCLYVFVHECVFVRTRALCTFERTTAKLRVGGGGVMSCEYAVFLYI